MIDEGEVASRAELARRLGVSRARVAQMLQLLMLCPTIIDAIVQLADVLILRQNVSPVCQRPW